MVSNIVLTALTALSTTSYLFSAHGFEVPYADNRFRTFDDLSWKEKKAARDLGYNETTWNGPGTADFEWISWWYLAENYYGYYEVDNFVELAAELGFVDTDAATAEDSWDCWVNHYTYYSWEDLVTWELDYWYGVLGWDENSWDHYYELAEDEIPETQSMMFEEMSTEQKTAAVGLCYTQKLWDYGTLPFCVDKARAAKVGKNERTCSWVAQDLKRCNTVKKGALAIHCPNVCGTCDQYGCVDPTTKFYYGTKKSTGKVLYKDCKFVKKKDKCSKDGMEETCPKKCSVPTCSSA